MIDELWMESDASDRFLILAPLGMGFPPLGVGRGLS